MVIYIIIFFKKFIFKKLDFEHQKYLTIILITYDLKSKKRFFQNLHALSDYLKKRSYSPLKKLFNFLKILNFVF